MNWTSREEKGFNQKDRKYGLLFIRHGAKHDWYQNPKSKIAQPIPRHKEINEFLSKHILKMLEEKTSDEK